MNLEGYCTPIWANQLKVFKSKEGIPTIAIFKTIADMDDFMKQSHGLYDSFKFILNHGEFCSRAKEIGLQIAVVEKGAYILI